MPITHLMPIASASLLLVAQAVPNEVIKSASEIGALGVLLLYLWLVNTRTLPGLLKSFKDEAEAERVHNRETLSTIVDTFKDEKTACRDTMAIALQQMQDHRLQDGRSKKESS